VRETVRGPDDRLKPKQYPSVEPLFLGDLNAVSPQNWLSIGSSHMGMIVESGEKCSNLRLSGENLLGQCAQDSKMEHLDSFNPVRRFASQDDYINAKLDKLNRGNEEMPFFRSVHCGKDFTIAVTSDGTDLYSCGCNDAGQLGIGFTKNRFKMYRVPLYNQHDENAERRKIKQVACGSQHVIVLYENGEMSGFGSNAFGQLASDNSFNQVKPIKLPRFQDLEHDEIIEDVKCGLGHSLFRTNKGRLYVVGRGLEGQLGVDQKQTIAPLLVDSICSKGRVTHISCGFTHSLAVVEEGAKTSVYIWGSGIREAAIAWGGGHATVGRHRKAGDEHEAKLYLELDRSSLNDLQVSSGAYHSILHSKNDGLFTAGYGSDGQIGNGKRKTETSFVNITPYFEAAGGSHRDIISVRGGFACSVALSSQIDTPNHHNNEN